MESTMKKSLLSLTLLLAMTSCGIDVPLIPFVENEAPIKAQAKEYVALETPVQTLR